MRGAPARRPHCRRHVGHQRRPKAKVICWGQPRYHLVVVNFWQQFSTISLCSRKCHKRAYTLTITIHSIGNFNRFVILKMKCFSKKENRSCAQNCTISVKSTFWCYPIYLKNLNSLLVMHFQEIIFIKPALYIKFEVVSVCTETVGRVGANEENIGVQDNSSTLFQYPPPRAIPF